MLPLLIQRNRKIAVRADDDARKNLIEERRELRRIRMFHRHELKLNFRVGRELLDVIENLLDGFNVGLIVRTEDDDAKLIEGLDANLA